MCRLCCPRLHVGADSTARRREWAHARLSQLLNKRLRICPHCCASGKIMTQIYIQRKVVNVSIFILCGYTALWLCSLSDEKSLVNSQKEEEFLNIYIQEFGEITTPQMDMAQVNFRRKLQQRQAIMRNYCSKHPTINSHSQEFSNFLLRKFLFDKKYQISWCPTYKAASTTFMTLFAKMGGILTKKMEMKLKRGEIQVDKLARIAYPPIHENKSRLIKLSNRLLVVRHPFARLLSAYRDKLEHRKNREFYYKKYGKHIAETYGKKKSKEEPSFVDFLRYIASGKKPDEHWRPYYQECIPCFLDYNIILKTENLIEEFEQFLITYHIPLHGLNHTWNVNAHGHTDWQKIKEYYSQVPLKLLKLVYYIYKPDFEMFGYSPHPYFEMSLKEI